MVTTERRRVGPGGVAIAALGVASVVGWTAGAVADETVRVVS